MSPTSYRAAPPRVITIGACCTSRRSSRSIAFSGRTAFDLNAATAAAALGADGTARLEAAPGAPLATAGARGATLGGLDPAALEAAFGLEPALRLEPTALVAAVRLESALALVSALALEPA